MTRYDMLGWQLQFHIMYPSLPFCRFHFCPAGEGIAPRTFTNLRATVEEAYLSRIYAGAHWNQVGAGIEGERFAPSA